MTETLDGRWYDLLLGRADKRTCARGCVLWTEGTATEGLFLLESGAVRLTREDDCGRCTVVGEESAPAAILTPGLFDYGPNCTTATTLTSCILHLVTRSSFIAICQENPDLLLNLIAAFSLRDRRSADFIDLVTVGAVRQRVARLLFDVQRQCGSTHFVLPYSHGALAQSLGTVREVLFRNLKHLQSEGVIQFRGSEIVIENEEALREAAGILHETEPVFDCHGVAPTPRYLAIALRRP